MLPLVALGARGVTMVTGIEHMPIKNPCFEPEIARYYQINVLLDHSRNILGVESSNFTYGVGEACGPWGVSHNDDIMLSRCHGNDMLQ